MLKKYSISLIWNNQTSGIKVPLKMFQNHQFKSKLFLILILLIITFELIINDEFMNRFDNDLSLEKYCDKRCFSTKECIKICVNHLQSKPHLYHFNYNRLASNHLNGHHLTRHYDDQLGNSNLRGYRSTGFHLDGHQIYQHQQQHQQQNRIKKFYSLNEKKNSPHYSSIFKPVQSENCGLNYINQTGIMLSLSLGMRIVGGKQARLHEFPWIVSLQKYLQSYQKVHHFCGGTIINQWFIITAAHCLHKSVDKI